MAYMAPQRIVHCSSSNSSNSNSNNKPTAVCGVLLARSGSGTARAPLRVLSTISLFQDSGPNTGKAERPSEILQLANLGVGHRMQRRKQHTNTPAHLGHTTTNNANDMARIPYPGIPLGTETGRTRRYQSTCAVSWCGPHGISASHRAPLTHRTPDARRGTKVTRSPRLPRQAGLASPSTTHATASDSTCRKPIRQVMARHVPPAPTHRERRPCASCHHAGPRLVAGLGRRLDSADMGHTCIPRHCSLHAKPSERERDVPSAGRMPRGNPALSALQSSSLCCKAVRFYLSPKHDDVSIRANSGRLALDDRPVVIPRIHDCSREFYAGYFLSSAARYTKYIIAQIPP